MMYRWKSPAMEARRVPVFQEGMDEVAYREEMESIADWCGGTTQWSRVRPISILIDDPGERSATIPKVAKPGYWIVRRDVPDDFLVYEEEGFLERFEPIED